MASPLVAPHVVIFPFMAHGHTLPLLSLSKALSHRNIKVTLITTPSNAKSISQNVANHPNISLLEIHFPTEGVDALGLPRGIESTSQLPSMEFWFPFVLATKLLQKPFEQVLQSMRDSQTLPICVISDFFLGWTLKSCNDVGVPRLVFHGMGVLSMAICKSALTHRPYKKAKSVSDPLVFPGLELPFVLSTSELPDFLFQVGDPNDDPYSQFSFDIKEAEENCWGVVFNSFEELEGGTGVSLLESFYQNEAKAWCLGPFHFYDDLVEGGAFVANNNQGSVLTEWLDGQVTAGSVVYVAFGTQVYVTEAQLDEVVLGLEEAHVPFVLVVRSTTWSPPSGIQDRLKGRGMITNEWVNQRQTLSHRAVGGFLSHCGWNSVIESISAGVPILAWPTTTFADTSLNVKFVVEGLGTGLALTKVKDETGSGIEVSRHAVCEGVRELMLEGEKGRNAKERAQDLGRVACRAVQQGGSSYQALDKLIDQVIKASSA